MDPKNYVINATADAPDSRDLIYQPALIQLQEQLPPPDDLNILDQGREGACTGFGLAANINYLKEQRGDDVPVSPRMLYEMAKRHDEWPGENYDGSSIRAAIKGWQNMGVCSEKAWSYNEEQPRELTIAAAKEARRTTIGAYYRIQPIIAHFHAALCEVGIIYASAKVHSGWLKPRNGRIPFRKKNSGGHAFAIVGYDHKGFWVQNSWSTSWGQTGVAHWLYEDWIANIMDAWVVQLALPTPQIFGLAPQNAHLTADNDSNASKGPKVARSEIAGHFVHVDDGKFKETDAYWSTPEDVKQTAEYVAASDKYDHLMIYAHGGLNAPKASAQRIAAMKEGFKRNGIYPFHLMYDTGLIEELKDVIFHKGRAAEERAAGWITDVTDRLLEGLLAIPGTLLWDEMKQDAHDAFKARGAGTKSLEYFIDAFNNNSNAPKKIHLIGHSTGAIVIAHLLKRMENMNLTIGSCSLLAPAATVKLYNSHYVPILSGTKNLKINHFNIYCLNEQQELDDTVGPPYRKSLLYLVSRAFERARKHNMKERPLLGMKRFHDQVDTIDGKAHFFISSKNSNSTQSTTHGGFDNDPITMNHTLKTILGNNPSKPFTPNDLKY